MSFVFSIGPSHTIPEIVTSHIYRLKKTKSRNVGDLKLCVFFNQKSAVSYILSVKVVAIGDHEIYQEQVQVMLFYSTILLLYSVSIYSYSTNNF